MPNVPEWLCTDKSQWKEVQCLQKAVPAAWKCSLLSLSRAQEVTAEVIGAMS